MALSDRAEEILAKQLGNGRAAEFRAALDLAYDSGGNDTLNARGRLLASILFGRTRGEEFCDISDDEGYPSGSRVEELLIRLFGSSDGLELYDLISDAYGTSVPAPDSDFDFNDSARTWQDAAGTIPADTVGDVVERIDDRIAGGSPLLLDSGTGAVLAAFESGVKCGQFDTSSYYTLAASIARHELGDGDFTIVSDVNLGASPTGAIFSKNSSVWSDPYANYTIRLGAGCEYWCSGYIGSGDGASMTATPGSGVLQIAITQDGTTPAQAIYFDGVAQEESTVGIPQLVADEGQPFMLGSNGGGNHCNFKIRRVRVFKGVILTPAQLAAL
jgi:hypothetical protein